MHTKPRLHAAPAAAAAAHAAAAPCPRARREEDGRHDDEANDDGCDDDPAAPAAEAQPEAAAPASGQGGRKGSGGLRSGRLSGVSGVEGGGVGTGCRGVWGRPADGRRVAGLERSVHDCRAVTAAATAAGDGGRLGRGKGSAAAFAGGARTLRRRLAAVRKAKQSKATMLVAGPGYWLNRRMCSSMQSRDTARHLQQPRRCTQRFMHPHDITPNRHRPSWRVLKHGQSCT